MSNAEDNTEGVLDRAERLFAEDRRDEVAALLERPPAFEDSADRLRLARMLDGLERRAEAERLLRELADEGCDEALVDLTLMLEDEASRIGEADALLRALPPEREAAARVARGRHYRAEDDVPRALAEYERGCELRDLVSLRFLAGTLSHTGESERAEALYRDPPFGRDDPELMMELADHLDDLGRHEEQEEVLRDLVARGVPFASVLLGDLLAELGGRELEVVPRYLAAIRAGESRGWANLGAYWRDRGRVEPAERALRQGSLHGDAIATESLGRLAAEHDDDERRGDGAEATDALARLLIELLGRPDCADARDVDALAHALAVQLLDRVAAGASPDAIAADLTLAYGTIGPATDAREVVDAIVRSAGQR